MNQLLKSKKHTRTVLSLALPMAGTRLINMLTYFIGMALAGHLGINALAACALINSTYIFLFVVGMSVLFAVGVVIAQVYGAKEYRQIGEIFQQSIILCILIFIPLSICFYHTDQILLALGEQKDLMPYVHDFFTTMAWGGFPVFLLVVLQQVCFAIKKQSLVIRTNLISFAAFVPVAYALIHGTALHSSFGIRGLAYSVIFSCSLNSVLILFALITNPIYKRYAFFDLHDHRQLKQIKKLFKVGWPMMIQFSSEVLIFAIIAILIGKIGTVELSAFQIAIQWQGLSIVPIFGITEAISILIGHAAGARNPEDMNHLLKATLSLICYLCLFVSLIYLLFPQTLAMIYGVTGHSQNAIAIRKTVKMFFLTCIFSLFFDAIKNIITGALRGLHDTQYAMWINTVTTFCITLPLGYWMVNINGWPVAFYFVAYSVAFLIASIMMHLRWKSMYQKILKHNTSVSQKEELPAV
mgnify:CR=1 FL=1